MCRDKTVYAVYSIDVDTNDEEFWDVFNKFNTAF